MNKKLEIPFSTLEFDALVSGNDEDELVIFLHGFPETSFMWRNLIKDVSNLGFYCLAPNMRGYSIKACPKGKKHYEMDALVKDVLSFADWAGKDKFHLVGHDWGALIGWHTVFEHENRILSWTALSVPHPKGFAKALKTDEDQKKKSAYIKMFMIPFLPEWKLRKNNFELLRKIWKYSSDEEVQDYLSVFKNKRCLTGALNYYRANFGKNRRKPLGKVSTPTLFIWGEKERYIGKTAAMNNKDYMSGESEFLKVNGGHWLVQTNYNEVKAALCSHLRKHKLM